MKQIVLPNTSLCAIVRDEIMNPAGGIVDFVESTVPFVEEAVIVDTGSVDGTREVLKKLKRRFRNLRVFDRPFDSYANSRNYSLEQATMDRVLILDADERLTTSDFRELASEIKRYEAEITFYALDMMTVFPYFVQKNLAYSALNPRLFKKRHACFYTANESSLAEIVIDKKTKQEIKEIQMHLVDTKIKIKHFKATELDREIKIEHWYKLLPEHVRNNVSPSEIPSLRILKTYNPQREMYR